MKTIRLGFILWLCAACLQAQPDLQIGGRKIQMHGFASQGFAYSDGNNYLTMKTSEGSFAATDGGLNVSTQLTDKLRVGAQMYFRNLGQLGDWQPVLDWGLMDYRFKDWFGIRGGRVKNPLGLFGDTQDNEFLHTWALMPQSMYPVDLRSAISHNGADAYGAIPLQRLGQLEYVVYGGSRTYDPYGGYPYSLQSELSTPTAGLRLISESGTVMGADLRWRTPLPGLTLGASHARFSYGNHGFGDPGNFYAGDNYAKSTKVYTHAFYFDYSLRRLRLFAEYQKNSDGENIFVDTPGGRFLAYSYVLTLKPWYVAATYRVHRRLELGSYYSRLQGSNAGALGTFPAHMFDNAITARVDLTSHWHVKVEGHFIDGTPFGGVLRGFYMAVNPNGFKNDTNLLIVRTGVAF